MKEKEEKDQEYESKLNQDTKELEEREQKRQKFLQDTLVIPEQKLLDGIKDKYMTMNPKLNIESIDRGYNYISKDYVLIPEGTNKSIDIKASYDQLISEGILQKKIDETKLENWLGFIFDNIILGFDREMGFEKHYDEVTFMVVDFNKDNLNLKFFKKTKYTYTTINGEKIPNLKMYILILVQLLLKKIYLYQKKKLIDWKKKMMI